MLNLFGIKKTNKLAVSYIPDVCMEPIRFHFDKLGIEDYKIIPWNDPEIEKYPNRPKAIKNNPQDTSDDPYMNTEVCILLSRFTQRDVNDRIIANLYDEDWQKEAKQRGLESWKRNFGENIPFGDDPGALHFVE